ncbi:MULTISPECIES: hypothetical protein [Burkholderia cepacia complex]|uniref:hypothetical protein n=1 Tax=Burkholderia cepacia complex TaxID=87882 RepID=UPI001E566606|nr:MULTISPECIES: hypothetical protein [Burkholderia cepacia complex]
MQLVSVFLCFACTACSRNDVLPRNMSLAAFNPHRRWDGKKETLIDAAKAATSAPVSPVKPAAHPVSPRTGRVHVPDGYMPPEKPQAADPPRAETTAAPVGAYRLT